MADRGLSWYCGRQRVKLVLRQMKIKLTTFYYKGAFINLSFVKGGGVWLMIGYAYDVGYKGWGREAGSQLCSQVSIIRSTDFTGKEGGEGVRSTGYWERGGLKKKSVKKRLCSL